MMGTPFRPRNKRETNVNAPKIAKNVFQLRGNPQTRSLYKAFNRQQQQAPLTAIHLPVVFSITCSRCEAVVAKRASRGSDASNRVLRENDLSGCEMASCHRHSTPTVASGDHRAGSYYSHCH